MNRHIEYLKEFVVDFDHFEKYCAIVQKHWIVFKSFAEIKRHRKAMNRNAEAHHMFPIALGGEDVIDNIVVLPGSVHLEAHYHLYKATLCDKMTFAFNQMRRYIKKHVVDAEFNQLVGQWYEEARGDISISLSRMAKKRVAELTDEEKELQRIALSKAGKGRVPVIFINTGLSGTIKTIDFDPNIHRYHSTGTTKSDECKAIMSEKAKPDYRGFAYHNPVTKEILYFHIGSQPDGWVRGSGVSNKHTNGTFFYHNPQTHEQKRFPLDKQPEGWISGRCKFNNAFNEPVLKHMVTGHVMLAKISEPFYASPKSKFVYLYVSEKYGKIITPTLKFIVDDICICDAGTMLLHIQDPMRVYTPKTKDVNKLKYFGKNLAVMFNITQITKEDLTLELCDDILKTHSWKYMVSP